MSLVDIYKESPNGLGRNSLVTHYLKTKFNKTQNVFQPKLKMRFQQAQALEKMRSEQEEQMEKKRDADRAIRPVRLLCQSEYESARAWNDPIGQCLARIKNEIAQRSIAGESTLTGRVGSAREHQTTQEGGSNLRNAVTFQIHSSTELNQ